MSAEYLLRPVKFGAAPQAVVSLPAGSATDNLANVERQKMRFNHLYQGTMGGVGTGMQLGAAAALALSVLLKGKIKALNGKGLGFHAANAVGGGVGGGAAGGHIGYDIADRYDRWLDKPRLGPK